MKKLAFYLLAGFIGLGFYACQDSGSASEAAESTDVVATSDAPSAPAEAPAVNLPEWQTKAENMARTTVSFAKEEYDYGKVNSGEKVTYKFKFTNTGSEPLELTNVKASCGCTTPSYSTAPVAPGEEGYIDVEFDTTGKRGIQSKTITVTGNFDGDIQRILRITGEVLTADS